MTQILFSTDYFSFEKSERGTAFVRSGDEVLIVPLTDQEEVILKDERLLDARVIAALYMARAHLEKEA